jgi:hypothetical protein
MSEDRFIVGIGEGKFNVIVGHQLNDRPLSRTEADRLAHGPVKPAATDLGRGPNGPESGPNVPPKQAPKQPQPAPAAPAVDLRPTRADAAGGSCGFRIKGSPTW